MSRVLCLLLFTLSATLGAQQTSVSASICRVSFRYPATWELVPASDSSDHAAGCSATLRPKNWARLLVEDDSLDRYSVHVLVREQSVDETLQNAFFELEGSRWFVTGSAGSRDSASVVSGPGWRGAYGISGFRCFREGKDGPSRICEVPFVVLGTPLRSATILGGVASEEVVAHLLATFRFRP
jgi:hypothetical protein